MSRRILPIERIAKIKTADLPISHSAGEPKEHYVYVREYDRQKQVYKVNVCTHLEKYDKDKRKKVFDEKHLKQVKNGNTYPIPVYSADFPLWTGIKREVYEVPKGKMYGWNCAKIKGSRKRAKFDSFYS